MTAIGTYINREKSVLIPVSILDYLGFTINCKKGTVKIPKEMWEAFKKEVSEILMKTKIGYKS